MNSKEKFRKRLAQACKDFYREAHGEETKKGIYYAKLRRHKEQAKNL